MICFGFEILREESVEGFIGDLAADELALLTSGHLVESTNLTEGELLPGLAGPGMMMGDFPLILGVLFLGEPVV